jgi:hypothetical protein
LKEFSDATAIHLKMGYYTIRLDKSNPVTSSFLGASTPQELTMEVAGSLDITILKANGIPRGYVSSP